MCTHPEHRVEVLPDGQIDETHVITPEVLAEMEEIAIRVFRLAHPVFMTTAWEEDPDG